MAANDSSWRRAIAGIGLAGALAFGSLLAYSFVDPLFVESTARGIVRAEVEERVHARLDRLDGATLAGIARSVSAANTREIDALERKIEAGVPARVAAVIARMLEADCECRREIAARVHGAYDDRIAGLRGLNDRLDELIRAQYRDVAFALTREFRIFTGANALVFALMGAIAAIRRRAGLQLVLPAAILLVAASTVGYLYLFEQDWLRTVLFGDYVGLGYFAYLGLAVAFLADIALNGARVTCALLNALFQALGLALQATPC